MTQLLLYLSLALSGVVIVVLVVYLVAIIHALWSAKISLAKLADGLVTIRDNTQALPPHMKAINGGLTALLQELLAVNNNLEAVVKVVQSDPTKEAK